MLIFRRDFALFSMAFFLNILVDIGHKVTVQNVIFKSFDAQQIFIFTAIVNALILLPFIVMFSSAGYLSDRFAKTDVLKYSALGAVFLCIVLTVCYAQGWFIAAFWLTLLLAVQSAIFSPAKYGSIRLICGDEQTLAGNGYVQAITTIGILLSALLFSSFI